MGFIFCCTLIYLLKIISIPDHIDQLYRPFLTLIAYSQIIQSENLDNDHIFHKGNWFVLVYGHDA